MSPVTHKASLLSFLFRTHIRIPAQSRTHLKITTSTMASLADTLPADFLSCPGPKVTVEKIDFTKNNLPAYADLYAVVLDNVFSADECNQLVRAAEARTNGEWEKAMVNIGNYQQRLILDIRDCGRIIWDDRDLVEKLWNRVKNYVPEIQSLKGVPLITGNGPAKRQEVWQMSRLNERMRFLKYGPGQYFQRENSPNYEPFFLMSCDC